MKRIIALILTIITLMSVASCGSDTSTTNDNSTPQNNTQEDGDSPAAKDEVTVDENLLSIDITLPASFFADEDMTAFDPDAYAEEQGFKKAVLNDDGSVTVTMTKAKHRELLDEMTKSIEDAFSDMVQSDDTPYITEIKHSDSYDKIDISVNRQGYEDDGIISAFIPLTVYFSAAFYQMFAGVDQHCEIKIIDAETGDTIESAVYPDALTDAE